MSSDPSLNDVVRYAFAKSVSPSQETRQNIAERFPKGLADRFEQLLHDSCWPAEPWTQSASLQEAAKKVEPSLRNKYPELDDESVKAILNYACFSWK